MNLLFTELQAIVHMLDTYLTISNHRFRHINIKYTESWSFDIPILFALLFPSFTENFIFLNKPISTLMRSLHIFYLVCLIMAACMSMYTKLFTRTWQILSRLDHQRKLHKDPLHSFAAESSSSMIIYSSYWVYSCCASRQWEETVLCESQYKVMILHVVLFFPVEI